MKKIILSFLFLISIFSYAETRELDDEVALEQFDQPFLLGKWAAKSRYDREGNQYSMRLFLASDNSYSILYLKNKKVATFDYGMFKSSENNLRLNSEYFETSVDHKIDYSFNKLLFDQINFIKIPEFQLAGSWVGIKELKDNDDVLVKRLILEPNYIVKVSFSDKEGKTSSEEGIYIVEQNKIMFLYRDGTNVGEYSINNDELKINLEKGGMILTMKKEVAM